tara:strand:+ start:103 stop:969 length:867 start_codon:yes stop_codon:yes gene_type:complete
MAYQFIKDLKRLKIINDKNVHLFSKKTRDKKINVFRDKISEVIFIKNNKLNKNYYNEKRIDTIKGKSHVTTIKKKIILKNLNDDSRRYNDFKSIIKNKKILDFGCGLGGFIKLAKKKSKVCHGLEINKSINKKLQKNLKIFTEINEINTKYDVITMFHVLEHLEDPIKQLKNLRKKLNNKGKIIIEVPSSKDVLFNIPEFKNFSLWSEHLMLHTKSSLRKIIRASNFKVERIYNYQRYSLDNHLGWFLNRKPGGMNIYNNKKYKKLFEIYNKFLIQKNCSDTIIAIIK